MLTFEQVHEKKYLRTMHSMAEYWQLLRKMDYHVCHSFRLLHVAPYLPVSVFLHRAYLHVLIICRGVSRRRKARGMMPLYGTRWVIKPPAHLRGGNTKETYNNSSDYQSNQSHQERYGNSRDTPANDTYYPPPAYPPPAAASNSALNRDDEYYPPPAAPPPGTR